MKLNITGVIKKYLYGTVLVLFSTGLFLGSCNFNKKEIEETPHWFTKYFFFSQDKYYQYFKTNIKNWNSSDFLYSNQIRDFYNHNKNIPLWTVEGYQEKHINAMMSYLDNVRFHGFPEEIFFYSSISKEIEKIKSFQPKNEKELYQSLFKLEMLLTKAYVTYTSVIQYGITDPEEVNGGKWFFKYKSADSSTVIKALWASDTLAKYLYSIQPTNMHYKALQKELKKYLKIKEVGFKKIPEITVDSGKVNKAIVLVGRRLKLTGELQADYQPNDTLDEILLLAINRFRLNNSIEEKNLLDVETIRALNRDFQYYIDKLTANLERYRWKVLPQKDTSYIAVNLADFSLQLIRQQKSVLSMKVCCGETLSRKDSVKSRTVDGIILSFRNESPMLYGEIDQIVLNPQWFVPESIMKREYYSKLVKNSKAFLSKEKMFIIDIITKQQVNPDSIKWSKINPNKIPYRLVQTSGKHNSLGIIKFNFPNSESVYLHDTPNKDAFKKQNRAITHGCVRVEKPIDLGLQIFDYNEYDEEQLEQVKINLGEEPTSEEGEKYLEEKLENEKKYYEELSEQGKAFYQALRPTYIQMKKKMPVYLEYYTCFLGKNGDVQYRKDVYFKESAILFKINQYNYK